MYLVLSYLAMALCILSLISFGFTCREFYSVYNKDVNKYILEGKWRYAVGCYILTVIVFMLSVIVTHI